LATVGLTYPEAALAAVVGLTYPEAVLAAVRQTFPYTAQSVVERTFQRLIPQFFHEDTQRKRNI
jgi:hypothetical protein